MRQSLGGTAKHLFVALPDEDGGASGLFVTSRLRLILFSLSPECTAFR